MNAGAHGSPTLEADGGPQASLTGAAEGFGLSAGLLAFALSSCGQPVPSGFGAPRAAAFLFFSRCFKSSLPTSPLAAGGGLCPAEVAQATVSVA